jgi:peptide/nickel transport system substrate-binding protein
MALSQEDYMHAIVGNDDSLWKSTRGFFMPGTPLYNEEGGEILKGPRNFDAAKRLLAESGYAGEPVTCLVAQDISVLKAFGEVTADLIKRLGMNVDYAALDWGTTVARRAQKSPSGRGGWLSPLWSAGTYGLNPATNGFLSATNPGWPSSPQVEAEMAAWLDTKSLDEEKTVARRLNKAAFESVTYAPLGTFLSYQAWRKNVSGIVPGPLTFWGVSKTV